MHYCVKCTRNFMKLVTAVGRHSKNSPLPTSQRRKIIASLPDVITTPAFVFPPLSPRLSRQGNTENEIFIN